MSKKRGKTLFCYGKDTSESSDQEYNITAEDETCVPEDNDNVGLRSNREMNAHPSSQMAALHQKTD